MSRSMPGQRIEGSIRLTHADFIMQNHRVHGVSVLPGVTFLDIIYRVLAAQGIDTEHVALRNVLFSEPVTTREGFERELRITVEEPAAEASAGAGGRRFQIDSRWLGDGVERAPWRENARGEIVVDESARPEPLDVAGWLARATSRTDMETLYARTRGEQIVHGVPMKCFGTLHFGAEGLLAALRLDDSVAAQAAGFHLHPGKMDASTLVAFGQLTDVGPEGFIPFFVEYFRAPRAVSGPFHVLVPHAEVPSESGELLRNDYRLFDEAGAFLAEFRGISCKRIRHPELITRLLDEVAAPKEADQDPAAAVTAYLRRRIGALLGRDAAAVRVDAGFYDLGLDSVALLRMSEELEEVAGAALYPTLLFEFGDVESLARHLVATYPVRLDLLAGSREVGPESGAHPRDDESLEVPAEAREKPRVDARAVATGGAPEAASDATVCLSDVWVPAPLGAGGPRDLVLIDAPGELASALGQRGCGIVAVSGALPDLSAPGCPTSIVLFPAGPDAVWSLAAALVERRAPGRVNLLVVSADPALPALAATITAEVPAIRCRVLDIAFPGTTLAGAARSAVSWSDVALASAACADLILAELAELADESDDREARYVDGVRHVRRWQQADSEARSGTGFKTGGRYLITGGAGGIARLLVDHLVHTRQARLALIGRGPRPADLPTGESVHYYQADVTDAAGLEAAVLRARAELGRIDGVLHCAGSTDDGLFFRRTPAEAAAVWAAKTVGTVNLDAATAQDDLDFFVLFSSLSAVAPNAGQAAYAYGNAFQYHFADRRENVLAIAWPLWADGGMRVSAEAARRSRATSGLAPLPTDAALDVLERALAAGGPRRLAVLHGDPQKITEVLPPAEADPASSLAADPRVTASPSPRGPADPAGQPIAIIGLAGRYPGAADLAEFWRDLAAGRDAVTEVPVDRWDHAAYFDPNQGAAGRTYGKWGGFLDGVDRFDPGFFGISRRDAERMDPQERLFLTTAWQTFEDAGHAPRILAQDPDERVGVFVGVMWNHYQLLAEDAGGVAPTAMHAAVANRVSYCLDLRGPSLAVDTACSSSLTAVHLAVESIRRGESTMALAGGVNVSVHPQKYLQLAEGRFLSTDGRCRSFGAGGDGYVPGEGVGAVLLKPLDRALADGDHVYGVIAATALNHTGRTSGFTVPSPTAQGELVRDVLAKADWHPRTIGYLEAHGTGTALGDPIEVAGLRQAFDGTDLPAGGCALGSVKSNIGHLESAAGIAGLTKVLLQLKHGELAPSLHSAEANPHIDFADSPFRVQQSLEPWRAPDGAPRRAGISAFGAGGANAHVLVEEAPTPGSRQGSQNSPTLFVLSARDETALREYVERYSDFLTGSASPDVGATHPGVDPVTASEAAAWLVAEAARALGLPADVIDPAEPLADLGFDALAWQDLVRGLHGRWPSAPTPTPADSVADLVARLGTRVAAPSFARGLPDLDDLTYTLQVGRTQLPARFAAVVSDYAELGQALQAYLGPDSPTAAPSSGTEHLSPVDCVAAYRAGRLAEVAAAWLTGATVDWTACRAGRRARRVPLPTYPFQEQPCWIGRWKGTMRPIETSGPPATELRAAEPRVPELRPAEPFEDSEALSMRVLEPGIALLTMRDTVGNNMFTDVMTRGLQSAFAEIAAREDVRAVVLTGTADVFSMGATPDALEVLAAGGSRFTDVPFIYEGLLRCDRPVVAAIQGHASGGGLAFGLYADLVVLAREGVYSANFMKYGFTPGMGATYILEQRFGRTVAAEMFYTGRPFAGEELERRGANVAFAAQADVLATALGWARSIAEKSPHAVRVLKTDLAERALAQLPEVIARESAMHEKVFGAESADRIREHFTKVDGYRQTASPAVGKYATAPLSQSAAAAKRRSVEALRVVDPFAAETPAPVEASRPVPVAAQPTPTAIELSGAANPEAVTKVIVDVLCASLYLDPSEIDPALAFSEMGLDSIGAVELVRELNRAFGLDLDSVAVYDHPTVPRLVAHAGELAARDRELVRQATATAAPVVAVATSAATEPEPQPEPPAATVPGPPAAGKISLRPLPKSPRPVVATTPRRTVTEPVRDTSNDIAVIGMAGRFPDAPDLAAFWTNLVTGHDSVREVAERWDVQTHFDPDRKAPGRTYSKWAALLSDIDAFDAGFFRVSPLEAEAMDPQQRIFLQTAWAGIEDAGYAISGATGRPWGVFVGCAAGDYADLLRQAGENDSAHAFLGNSTSVLAARIAYHLNLTGPTLAVDTACSSSLVAVHLACQAILAGECEAAVAGGVALMLTPRMHILTSKSGMLSPTGRSAPFDASADGIVLGEACGAVVLKRLDRALADGDVVHGVILGSGVNGDGRTNGITAPSAASQSELISRVLRQSGLGADDLTYVEAHGTGTPLGDPIEAKALDLALGADPAGPTVAGSCGIGSVKGNIGHTTTAAGVAGLLKVLLALRNRTLPPTLHFADANPEIDFGRGRLRPVAVAEPWRAGASGRLIGAVSSFGFSGTNAHVVVAEAPARPDPAPADEPVAVMLSAPNEAALRRIKSRLAGQVREPAERPALVELAYTLAVGRSHFAVRDAAVVADYDELLRWLDGAAGPAGSPDAEFTRLVTEYLAGAAVIPERWYQGRSVRRVSLPTYPFAEDRHWVSPPPQKAVMAEPPKAAELPQPGTRRIASGDWLVADHVIGGTPLLPGVAALELIAEAAGADPRTAPFRIAAVQWQRPVPAAHGQTVVVTSTSRGYELAGDEGLCCSRARVETGVPTADEDRIDVDAVAWRCPERRSGADVYRAFAAADIEYGPSFQVLDEVRFGPDEALGVLRLPSGRSGEAARRPMHPSVLDGALQTIAVLAGATDPRPRVPFALAAADFLAPVPESGYSHVTREGSSFTVRVLDDSGRVCVKFTGLALRAIAAEPRAAEPKPEPAAEPVADIDGMLFVPAFREAAAPPVVEPERQRIAVLFAPGSAELADAVVAAHQAVGDEAITVPWDRDVPGTPDVVYLLADRLSPAASEDGQTAVRALLRVAKSLLSRSDLTVKAVVGGTVGAEESEIRPSAAGLLGLLGSLAAERPRWRVGCVDVGIRAWTSTELAEALRLEPCVERLVVLRDSHRWTRVLRPLDLPAPGTEPFRREGVYLIVGGTGGIGGVLSRHLASTLNARIALVGRRPVTPEITARLAELTRLGGRAIYLRADVTDAVALRRAVADTHREFGALNGAFHAALSLRDASIGKLDEQTLAETMAAKTTGAVAFGEALRDEALDLMVFFSSAISFTDSAGQGNYAAASTFEDSYALSLGSQCRFPVSVVNWGYWGSVGAVADDRYAEVFHALDVGSIEPRVGMAALTALLRARVPQALVVKAGPGGLARLGVELPTARGAAQSGDPVATARAAFADLEQLGPELLRTVVGPDRRIEIAELRRRFAVAPAMEGLFTALLAMLERAGMVRRTGDDVEPLRSGAETLTGASVGARHPELRPHVELLERCVGALPGVLSGRVRATDVLFAGGSSDLVEKVYKGQPAADFYHRLMADAVRDAVVRRHRESGDPVRILEVGAGTGAGSAFALQACAESGAAVEYTYTDVSAAFLNRGEAAFGGRYPFLRFELLDIERDPTVQGFAEHGYDLVLATNVLHATARMAQTLGNVRRLLRPGGAVLVNEVTAVSDFATLTFGLTPGWWRFEDAEVRLPGAPLVSPAGWRRLLADAGFADVRVSGFADTVPDELEQCVLIGTALPAPVATAAPAAEAAVPTATEVRAYVRRVFAEALRYREHDLDDRVTFENYGVDSLISLDIISRFEAELGPLPATLLFDHMTIEQLATHFSAERPGELAAVLTPVVTRPASVEVVDSPRRADIAEPTAPPASSIPDDAIAEDAIAVVGVSGRYPGAPTVDAFWHLLAEGRSGVTEIPAERWDWREHFDADPAQRQKTYSRWGGFLPDVDRFDPGFFGILPREAENIDPQERLFLETAWNLLEETGYLGEHTREPETGVFVGSMYGSYGQLGAAEWAGGQLTGAHSAAWSIANRVSYFLDLHGPSFAVDSACSSSLQAVLLACDSLRRGECRMAIAGGVNVILHPAHFVALSALNMLSADGKCKVFDASADGFVPGEGVGAVLLKPLRQAVADRDRIWGVIRGGQANAGGKTGGYTVPNPHAQAAVIGAALARAGVDPATVGYVEAHGTGTGLGDPIEVSALSRALGGAGQSALSCALGSVKANVGHLEGAAGIAGLTKVLLQLRHGRLAPCVNLDILNPKIELDTARFSLPRTLSPWPAVAGTPRRAGISSFGAGGANVHLVLEEYQGTDTDDSAGVPDRPGATHAFVLSARTRPQLVGYARRVSAFLEDAPVSLPELCYTSQVGRRELAERLVVLADSVDGLRRRLLAFAEAVEGGPLSVGVLAGSVSRGAAEADAASAAVVGEPAESRRLEELGRRWIVGTPVDWRLLWPGRAPRRVPFPTYPFEKKRYWLSTSQSVPAAGSVSVSPESETAETVCRYRRIGWTATPVAPLTRDARSARTVLLVSATNQNAAELTAAFQRIGARCVVATVADRFVRDTGAGYSFDPSVDDHCDRLLAALDERGLRPGAIIYEQLAEREPAAGLERALYPLVRLATGLLSRRTDVPLRVVFLGGEADPVTAAVAGALRTLALEHSRFSGAVVRTARESGWAERAVAELAGEDADVRYRDGVREARSLTEFEPPAPIVEPARAGGTYLITGGAGALGLHFAEHLAACAPVTIVLAGRAKPGPAAAARIATLSTNGSSVVFHRADVTSAQDVRALIAAHGPLHGVIHAAGTTRDAWAVRKNRAALASVVAPKALGAVQLDEATRDQPLDFFVLFSSVVGETGNAGQVDYAAANAFLHAFAEQRETRRRRGERAGRSVAIGWPLWADGGMTVDAATRELFARKWGMAPMRTAVGIEAFRRILAGGEPVVVAVEELVRREGVRPAGASPEATKAAAPASDVVQPSPVAPVAPVEVPVERLREAVEGRLRRLAAGFLLVDVTEVALTDDLMDTGFDSISLTELVNEVNAAYELDLLPTVLFECADLAAFAGYLIANHGAAIAAGVGTSANQAPATLAAVAAETTAASASVAEVSDPHSSAADPVAIVGMAAVLPGSPDLATFWRHLVAGDDLIGTAPADRLELHAHPDTEAVRAGFIEGVGDFDAPAFRVSPSEAALMDPQQRMFLQAVWRAVQDAGHRPEELAGTETALFVGVSTTDYADLLRQNGVAMEAHAASGIAHSILANRVSHVLGLEGPSEAVDTACSSSLVALHRAVAALRDGECAAAIVGGVNALLSPGLFTAFTASGMLSADGACKTFDARADGYVRGEGVGALLLKPLSAARADGDHVYAVVRGSAVNHGGRSTSLTAPNPESQAKVLLKAYRAAGVDPATVTAIEAHGTGTRLGDPVEIEGLKKAFAQLYADHGRPAPERPHIALGSVKTNIGHLEAAAGMAGLVKMLLAMEYGQLPPTIHFGELNPYLRLDGTPFFVNDTLRPWPGVRDEAGRLVRRAGVSSFGFGGTNAHVVLEAVVADASQHPVSQPTPRLLMLSAATDQLLEESAHSLAGYLRDHADADLAAVAYTLQAGRPLLPCRLAVIAEDPEQASRLLDSAARGADPTALVFRGRAAHNPPPAETPYRGEALGVIAAQWVAGAPVATDRLWPTEPPRRLPLPPTPLARRAHWFDDRASRLREVRDMEESAQHANGAAPAQMPRRAKVTLAAPTGRRPEAAETRREQAPRRGEQQPEAAEPSHQQTPPLVEQPPAAHAVAASLGDIAETVRARAAAILGLEPGEVGGDAAFSDLGLDSIFRMDLARRLNADFALELQAAELYEHDTVNRLAAHLCSGAVPAVAAGPQLAEPDAVVVVSESLAAEPPAADLLPADPAPDLSGLLARNIGAVLDRTLDPSLTFTANGFTSFDMLRVVSALERRFGALRKTLLFDLPTLDQLAGFLEDTFGAGKAAELLITALAQDEHGDAGGPITLTAPAPAAPADGPQPLIVRKRNLAGLPEVAELLADIDDRHAKEGGLAGRDIAPLAFVGSGRSAYFNFSRRDGDLFAWSYAGSEEDFPVLAAEWLDYASRYGFRPNFLSLKPLTEAAGVALTATPFGAVQRLENLAEFTSAGGKMTRLRYMLNRFEKTGDCTTAEYRPGTDPAVDRQVSDMIGRWAERKQMVNPYVAVVREELSRGVIGPRHRMFLTRRDGELMNVVIVTRIPSENAYLLDLEFYPKKMPTGGLEYAIVRILEHLRDEGVAMFSFGASFGVKVCDSDNAAQDIAEGLEELRTVGIFGEGNFQFKNKFRPTNLPIYLCQRADEHRTPLADVILMIASPEIDADVPGMLSEAEPQPAVRPQESVTLVTPPPAPAATEVPTTVPAMITTPTTIPTTSPATTVTRTATATTATRTRRLIDAGYNPLALSHADVDVDLVTDSWAEQELPAVAIRTAALQHRADQAPDPADFPIPSWLPFDVVLPTPSGRAAEALLCRSWPGPRGLVVHNGLFPTWSLSLLDTGFHAERVDSVGPGGEGGAGVTDALRTFPGDLHLPTFRARLAAGNGGTAFVAVELSGNACGGQPTSLANLRAVREAAAVHGVPVVLDATRLLENAVYIAEHEEPHRGADPWTVARELLSLADAATFSLSKDFGLTFGGLVAARIPALADRLREHVALRGREVGLASRKLLTAALADQVGVLDLVTERMAAVAELWRGLSDAGVPLAGPAGAHCVLLDVDRMPQFAGAEHAVESCLAWLYQGTGVRGAPHLAATTHPTAKLIRLAVPQGTPPARMREVATRIAELWRDSEDVPDLIPVGTSGSGRSPVHARFHPAAGLPDDIEAAMREGHRPQDENALVLAEATAAGPAPVERRILGVRGGEAEVFTAGRGPVLLLMHPFNIGAGVFARQFAQLADRFRLLTVHHPGVGGTTARDDITLDGLAAIYREVLDQLGIAGPVHVAGASFGGLVAQSFALRYPADTATLTLIGSSFKVGNRNGEVNRLSIVAKEDFDRVVEIGGSPRVAAERAELERLLLRCESMDPQIGLSYLDVFASQATLLARLPDIDRPTLIIQGLCDTVIPLKTAHLLHGAIPDAAYVELPDAGHFPCLSHPEDVHAALVPFLESHTLESHTLESAWR